MATVSSPARARKARASAPSPAEPPVPQPCPRLEEGWQPGPAYQPAPLPAPARPVERHGKCRLTLKIGATDYRLVPYPPSPGSDLVAIWTLRKIQPDPLVAPVAYAVASDGHQAHCTCPDHEINGVSCKHMMALSALRLIPAVKGGAL